MVIPKINSAHGSDTRNVLNRAIDSINVQGKSIQDLVAEGQLTPAQYATLIQTVNGLISKGEISIHDIDKNNFEIDETMIADSLRSAITGDAPIHSVPADSSITSRKLVDKSVTREKVSFLTSGKNKYDGMHLNGMSILTNGDIVSTTTPSSYIHVTPIESGKTYTVTKFQYGNRFRIGLYNKHPNESSLPINSSYYHEGTNSGAKQEHTFTNSVNAKYVVIMTNSNSLPVPDVQVEEGGQSTDFEPFVPRFFGSEIITSDTIKERTKSDLNYGRLIHPIGAVDFNTVNGDVTFGEDVEILIYENHQAAPRRVSITPQKYTTITTPYFKYKYIIFYRPSTGEIRGTNLNNYFLTDEDIILGSVQYNGTDNNLDVTGFENYYINGELPRSQNHEENKTDKNKHLIFDEINGVYNKPDNLESVAIGSAFELVNSSHISIYDIFDNLVNIFPEYVTKSIAGNDGSGLPINIYRFKPKDLVNESNFEYTRPKIIVTSAIHGYEQMSAWSTAKFFEDLCYNYSQKEQLEFMRFNVEFIVLPVCNPYGYDNNQRVNFNGVDLNRNFTENWQPYSTPGDQYYSGTHAASEVETNIIESVLNQHKDAIYHIDHHNISSGYPMFYVGTKREAQLGLNLLNTMTREWKKTYGEAPDDELFGYVKSSAGQGTMTAYTRSMTESITLETPWKMPFAVSKYDKVTTEVAVDLIGNTITSLCKNYM